MGFAARHEVDSDPAAFSESGTTDREMVHMTVPPPAISVIAGTRQPQTPEDRPSRSATPWTPNAHRSVRVVHHPTFLVG